MQKKRAILSTVLVIFGGLSAAACDAQAPLLRSVLENPIPAPVDASKPIATQPALPSPVPSGAPDSPPLTPPIALIYGGPGVLTGADDTLELATHVAELAGFETVEVRGRVDTDLLNRASVWVQPGGPNLYADRFMNGNGMTTQVRDFVNRGGGYVGFCGGAYSAMNNLRLIKGSAWRYDEYTMKIPIVWLGAVRFLHFEHGPYIQLAANANAEVVGRYEDGTIAAARANYGRGKVFISGPHPEASQTWPPIADADGSDQEIAIGMLREVAAVPAAF